MTDIVFTKTFEVSDNYSPQPANKVVPDWYKKLDSYIGGNKRPTGRGETTATIKRCMPVFDAISSGYILFTYVDLFVSQQEEIDATTNEPTGKHIPWYEWPSSNPLGFHPIRQAPNYHKRENLSENASYPKWMNPWAIKTPSGYSCLFLPPIHRDSTFSILPGVVDTDKYTAPVNFPFVLHNWGFEGLIPVGTPLAQVIPFKRESWKMRFGEEKSLKEQHKTTVNLKTKFFDAYKTNYRQTKEYN